VNSISPIGAEPDQPVEKFKMNDAPSDATLVSKAKAGELAAFEMLVSRHERQVYSVALRIVRHSQDAEDVTQQTFLSALEHLDGFRADARFSTWLMRIATHAALKILRKRRGLDFVSLEENTEAQEGMDGIPHPEYIADWRESPQELVHRNETLKLIDAALEQLDEKRRLVFVLRDVEGLSIQETAEALEITENNVKVRLLRARLQLREILTQSFGDPATRIVRGHHRHQDEPTSSSKI
jgi:RNA polymerase sigma-70 factor (ECF subfamily)